MTSFNWKDSASLVLAVLLAATFPTAAGAQTADARESDGLQEIIVTATRRETKLSDTPISMSAISAAQIEDQHALSIADIELSVPNLVFTQVTRQETVFSIRGTGVDNDTPGADAGVSVFIDDVPRTGVHDTTPELWDLQSVEVLRGPQGTLFGRNTTGGAVVMRTIAPSFDPIFKGQLTYGNDNLTEINGLATGPLVGDVAAGKISFLFHRRDGNVDNVTEHREDGRENSGSLRAQLLIAPADDLKLTFGGDYLRDTSQARLGLLESTFVPTLFPTLQFGPDVTNAALTPRASNSILGLFARLDWTTRLGTLTSVSGYRSVTSKIFYDPLGDPNTELTGDQIAKDRQSSEELRFASNADQRLKWVAGLFYLHLDRLDDELYAGYPVAGTAFSYAIPYGATSYHNQAVLTTSKAMFGNVTYSLLDGLDLTAGARYSWEHRSGHAEITPTEASGPFAASWSAFTPRGTISFKPNKAWLLYGTVSKGFTSGGFDAGADTSAGLATPFKPETVLNYELGAKLAGFERRVSVDAAIFQADYTNLQRTAFDSNPAVNSYHTTNAGKARVRGVELEASFLPISWLTLSANYAYTDAKYRAYDLPQSDGTVISYAGNIVPQVPRQQVHLGAEAALPWRATGGSLIGGLDYTYRSEIQFVDANDTPQTILDKTRFDGFLNMHFGWRSADERFTANLFVRDLTDKRALVAFPDFTPYFANLQEYANPADHIYLTRYTPPRTFGVTLTVRY
jgi:iron complex outermembrane receptor protein